MTPEEYILRLTEVSGKKYILMQDILTLTRSQSGTITEDGVDGLEKLIALKQARIADIDKLDEQFDVYFQRLKQELKIKSLDELKGPNIKGVRELQEVVESIMSVIREISEIEKQNNENAKKLLNRFGDEVKKLNQSRKVNQAYNTSPAMQPPSYFIDKKK